MSWDRQKATIIAEPEEPSLVLWLMVGIIAVITGVLLFVLHANHFLGALQKFSIWIVSGIPVFIWFIAICLRGWVYNYVMDQHQFESGEADYAQQQWTSWAGRYLAVLYSRVILPDGLTPSILLQAPKDLEQSNSLTRKIVLPTGEDAFSALLGGLDRSVLQDLSVLPLTVTLITDSSESEDSLQKTFSLAWQYIAGQSFPVPQLVFVKSRSFAWAAERIKSATLDVDLFLVHQTEGRGEYSDALATLLLTSDDVATKYQLSHHARLLRPMVLEPAQDLTEELDTFFATQSQSITAAAIVGDSITWGEVFSTLLASAKKYEGSWKPQQSHWLEKYTGHRGPFSPWIMAAVVSETAAHTKDSCLMLSGDKEQRYINTVTTGNVTNGEG